MNIKSKAMILAGAALVAAISLVPLATHAADPIDATEVTEKRTDTANVSITVSQILTLDVAPEKPNATTVEASNTTIGEGEFTATVKSNTGYQLLLKSDKNVDGTTPIMKDEANSTNTQYIPALASGQTLTIGTNAWAIKVNEDTSANAKIQTYTGLTTVDQLFYQTSTPAPTGATTKFGVGITVSSDLPSGTYSTDVTVTAAAV